MLLMIEERGSKIARNNLYDCHLSQVGRQMAIENSVFNDFLSMFLDSINVFDCRLSGVSQVLHSLLTNIHMSRALITKILHEKY